MKRKPAFKRTVVSRTRFTTCRECVHYEIHFWLLELPSWLFNLGEKVTTGKCLFHNVTKREFSCACMFLKERNWNE